MLEGKGHQSLIGEGVADFAGPPLIEVDGDRATALSYSFVLRRDAEEQRIYVWRLGAAHWEFARVDGEWRIHRRTHRQLDETGAGRELFGDTLARRIRGGLAMSGRLEGKVAIITGREHRPRSGDGEARSSTRARTCSSPRVARSWCATPRRHAVTPPSRCAPT